MQRISRRRVLGGTVGFGVGAFAVGRAVGASAQEATPAAAVQPLGYVSLRLRQHTTPEIRAEVEQIVVSEFVPTVRALPSYQGYLLGDVIGNELQSVAISVFTDESGQAAFEPAVEAFVSGLDPEQLPETPLMAEGDLLVTAPPAAASATPAASPAASVGTISGYVAVRVYVSRPGSDPREFAPLLVSDFVPIIAEIAGFQGYLYFVTDDGFASVSLYESQAAAEASTEAARGFVAANLTAYTDEDPQVINAADAFVDLPVLTRTAG